MAWKKAAVYEWRPNERRFDGAEDLKMAVMTLFSKATRVTVEEEVSECCEKWRGTSIWRSSVTTVGSTSACSSVGPCYPLFCPECGRKL